MEWGDDTPITDTSAMLRIPSDAVPRGQHHKDATPYAGDWRLLPGAEELSQSHAEQWPTQDR